jgi:CheY-like chemotaxis protein
MLQIIIELIKLIPSILWILLATLILILFYRPIRDMLFPRLSKFKVMGFEFSFLKDSMDAALAKAKEHDESIHKKVSTTKKRGKIELAEKSPQWKIVVPPEAKQLVLNRALQHKEILNGAQILWVDDHPESNLNEQRMFKQLNVEMDTAKSTDQAIEMLKHTSYDVMLSDIARDDSPSDGLDFLEKFREMDTKTPVIFYVGVIDPTKSTPLKSFGITNRPDELLHLVLDALERKKY